MTRAAQWTQWWRTAGVPAIRTPAARSPSHGMPRRQSRFAQPFDAAAVGRAERALRGALPGAVGGARQRAALVAATAPGDRRFASRPPGASSRIFAWLKQIATCSTANT